MYPGALTLARHCPFSLITFLFTLLAFPPPLSSLSYSSSSLLTSCTHLTGEQPWNVESIGSQLRSWLRSGVTVMQQCDDNDQIQSRLYDPEDDEFVEHVAGWNDQVEYDEDGEEEDENRRVVTIAR